MSKFFDAISLLQIPIGFFIGLVVLLILEFFEVGFFVSAGVLVLAILLYFAWSYIADRLSFLSFDWFLTSKKEREMHRQIDARDRMIGRIAIPLGMVLAFMAAQIWSPLEISEALF